MDISVYAPEWPSTVSQLALQARVRAKGMEGGDGSVGASLWLRSPQKEEWKQVCLCGNAALMLLDTQQAAVTLLQRLPRRPSSDITRNT